MVNQDFDIFLVVAPGLEGFLADEAREAGFAVGEVIRGGVTLRGGWADVWRANLTLRGATRVLVRLTEFRAMHLAQLDKRAKKLPWTDWFTPEHPIKVEAICRKSKIYHNKAAAQRIEGGMIAAGLTVSKDAELMLKVRIEDDLCTISVDTSGESLHKRGLKTRVNKAPMRETLASLFLRASGFDGTQTVVDPMCGSGTFILEAADRAAGNLPGRARSFAFEDLASFDPKAFAPLKPAEAKVHDSTFHGSDRDQGAVAMATANAEAAGLKNTTFTHAAISDATPPDGPPGIVIVNPPYGGRIGNRKLLFGLYAAFGDRMRSAFPGWRIAMVTSDGGLAKATGFKWSSISDPVDHGGQNVRLYQVQVPS